MCLFPYNSNLIFLIDSFNIDKHSVQEILKYTRKISKFSLKVDNDEFF
jgi:hypothetical protein